MEALVRKALRRISDLENKVRRLEAQRPAMPDLRWPKPPHPNRAPTATP